MGAMHRWLVRVKALLRRRRFPYIVTLRDLGGGALSFRVYSPVERHRVAEYGGEREILQCFLGLLKPDDVVYDIGASVGLFTVAAARRVARGVVYTFEPDPDTRARLIENVALNQLENVHVMPWAVSDSASEVVLYTDGAAGFAPSFVRQERPGAPTGQVRVSTRALDDALAQNELPLPDVLKIDIEGAEALCLAGAARLLQGAFGSRPRVLLLELHPDVLPAFGSSLAALSDRVIGFGYRLAWSQTRAAQAHHCYECID
jgi:FkbM family methyltransferase